MQAVDTRLYSTQQTFMSDLYSQNPLDQSTATIHDASQNVPRKRKVVLAFEDPEEVKTIELPQLVHDKFRQWSAEHEIASLLVSELKKAKQDSENKTKSETSEMTRDKDDDTDIDTGGAGAAATVAAAVAVAIDCPVNEAKVEADSATPDQTE